MVHLLSLREISSKQRAEPPGLQYQDIKEQIAWALGNLAGDNIGSRDQIIRAEGACSIRVVRLPPWPFQ